MNKDSQVFTETTEHTKTIEQTATWKNTHGKKGGGERENEHFFESISIIQLKQLVIICYYYPMFFVHLENNGKTLKNSI